MSWFPDIALGQEFEPGVRLERRALLAGAVGALGLAAAPAPRARVRAASDVDAFLDQAAALAKTLELKKDKAEDGYLFRLAGLLCDTAEGPGDPWGGIDDGVRFHGHGVRKLEPPRHLRAIQIGFGPGAKIPVHDHRDYNGVILCLEGDIHCRNFDMLEEGQGPDVVLRESVDALLTPGRFSTLSTTRDNLHELVAGPQGARVLDVFTYFEKGATSRYLEFQDGEARGERTSLARWR